MIIKTPFGIRSTPQGKFDPCSLHIEAPLASDCGSAVGRLAWYKADTVLVDGPVASWADSSGNGHTATRAVVSEQPQAAVLPGGGRVVRFLGNNNGLDPTGITDPQIDRTVYLLLRYTPGLPGTNLALSAASVNGGFTYHPDFGASNQVVQDYASNPPQFGPAAVCGWQVLTFLADNTNGFQRIYRNGTQLVSSAYAADSNDDTDWHIGSISGTSIGLIMDVAELQIYNVAHDAATIASQSACLRQRWGLFGFQGQ